MKCLDIQSIIKNYESYVIGLCSHRALTAHNRIRPLAKLRGRPHGKACVLVRAPSVKLQASSPKLLKHQAASIKPQAASVKLKATSNKLFDPRTTEKFQASRTEVLNADKSIVWMLHMEGNLMW